MCTTYAFNDKKLSKIINNYIEKQDLNDRLQRISDQLRVWHEQFFEDKNAAAHNSNSRKDTLVKFEDQHDNFDSKFTSSSKEEVSIQSNFYIEFV